MIRAWLAVWFGGPPTEAELTAREDALIAEMNAADALLPVGQWTRADVERASHRQVRQAIARGQLADLGLRPTQRS